ncbi:MULTISPECIES: endonuclease/exonuclease/phosphatase family protein [Streptomyces]|uniref:Endonuclease/exonuclease/phosphatase n=1 Tax=Streptomyces lycii TaxID=2654337 RepID=A0ABQ7FQM5_9ACTN|nr:MULTISPECIES: endonuclease/exonuclease/phosphatase family protein [Streptomyces]KAF4411150.1 endonuclease/exonuclease/phosphatase [Streptomyces lycii]PGH50964.1 endonuclease/exonuclease/phosphatase [Streptomyces sp. Ru87]
MPPISPSAAHPFRDPARARLRPAGARTGALLAVALAAGLLTAPGQAHAAQPRVHDVQGGTRVSPFDGEQVTDVPGIVTAVRAFGSSRGFWVQDPEPDRDPATSEGVFVFTGSKTPGLAPGDSVLVSGTVGEYYPGGEQAGLQSVTQISKAAWTVVSRGNELPAAFRLDAASVPNRYAPEPGGSIEPLPLRPHRYALDRYESLEGMRAQVTDAPVVGPSSEYNELWVTADPHENPTERGGTLYGSYRDQNGARLKVASLIPFAERPFPRADVGDALAGTTAGPLDYDQFGGYELQATELGALDAGGLERETTRAQRADELSVATYNVENLSPADPRTKFDRLAEALVHNLASPDIVALEEVQDNTGPEDDGVVGADETLRRLTEAVTAAGGPEYAWRQIDPADGEDGGQPGGNIRVAFLYNPERVSFPDAAGGDATTPVTPVRDGGEVRLSANPGRIDPLNPAWEDSRKPLAAEFRFRGRPVFVVAGHFNSKGGDQALDSRFQPPARSSEIQRTAQAAAVSAWVKSLLAADRKARIVVAGDLNDFGFSPALRTLTEHGTLTDQVSRLPRDERYGYVYNGNSQALDHILTSRAVRRADYDIVHINAEFADQASDHDPQVLRFRP